MHSLLVVNSHFLSFKKPLLAKDGQGHRVPLHLSVLSLRVLGPPHPEEGEKKRVSIGRGRPNHVRGPGPVGRHHGSAGEVEETALPFLATLQR